MRRYLPAAGIRFNDCCFSEPVRLIDWNPPRCAGLIVVLAQDGNWAPMPFQPLYFGELGHNTSAAALVQEYRRFFAVAAGRTVMVAVLELPFSTTTQRLSLRGELIRAYNPTFQIDAYGAPVSELARKVEELEKKNQEQAAQVMMLLANRPAEPGPEQPRRRIGFVP